MKIKFDFDIRVVEVIKVDNMSKSLMDSLSVKQLELCEKGHLIEYIIDLKKLCGEEPKKSLLEQFIDETCDLTDCETDKNGNWVAPSTFNDIFLEYKMWLMGLGHRFDYSKKLQLKEDLIKWQKESVYGCFMAKTKKEGQPNGSLKYPLFNLVVNQED